VTKRILTVDGGGLRGVFSAAVIEVMEKANGGKAAWEIFDAFVGTSAGAYLATGLASGKTAGDLKQRFIELGEGMSQVMSAGRSGGNATSTPTADPQAAAHTARLAASAALTHQLKEVFGEKKADEMKRRFAVVTRNMDLGRVVFFGNFPDDQIEGSSFWKVRDDADDTDPVWKMVLRSAALPPLFAPDGPYLDGGVSPFANPSYAAYVGVQRCLGWNPYKEELKFYSVGTGYHNAPRPLKDDDQNDIDDTRLFSTMVGAMMQDINFLQHQIMKRQRSPGHISYQRYNVTFSEEGFEQLGLPLSLATRDGKTIFKSLANTATPEVGRLAEIGTAVGEKLIHAGHFDDETEIDPSSAYMPFGAPGEDQLENVKYYDSVPSGDG
jgi:hypothetical protein